MNNELFNQYAEVQKQIKELEEKKDTLSALVLEDLQKNELSKFQHDNGTFSVIEKTTWEYDELTKLKISDKKKEIKSIEEKAQEEKTAKEIKSNILRFQLAK